MAIAANTGLGPYRIIAPLGAGGMGEVYRAHDERIGRDVAIKVLPPKFAADADRLRRFAQEARAAGQLNHPNILTIYDIGTAAPEQGGAPYLVAELLAGAELRQQLNECPLPIRRCLDYAQQIASGLAAAHEKGIVHRDLKPENLFVTDDGRVKILDFGLAKLRATPAEPVDSQAPTQRKMTDPGTVLGTVGYMAPEQVRGQEADHRADIFAFGVILYEMLSGRRAFSGASSVEVMNAILKEEPPELSESNAKISPQLERIVRRCLEKKPERRFQSTGDLGFALEALATPSGAALATATNAIEVTERGGWRERMAWLVAGVAVLAALALGAAYFNRSTTDARAVRLAFAPPANLAFDNGFYDSVTVSPDGQKLAFTGRSADGKRQLWVRSLAAMDAQLLPDTEDAQNPFWSPDSRSLGFGARGKLKRIELAGGRPQMLCDASATVSGTWSRAGVILFSGRGGSQQSGLFQIPATGGEPQPVTSLAAPQEVLHLYPHFLPDGRHFLYRTVPLNRTPRVFVGSLDSKEVKLLLNGAAPALYAPPGWLLFVRDGALVAQRFDADRLELQGEAFIITPPTNTPNVFGIPYSVSDNGVLIWQGDRLREYQLVWFDRAGKESAAIGPRRRVRFGNAPRLSPDGKRVVNDGRNLPSNENDIWVIDLERNLPERLTFQEGITQLPLWSPDGRHVLFFAARPGGPGLYLKAANGTGSEELLLERAYDPIDWSADGRFIFYHPLGSVTRRDVWVFPVTGSRQPYPLLDTEFDECHAQLSPDGRWLAYTSDESGSYEIYVQPFTPEGKLGGDKRRISTDGGSQPRWRRNGQELFYVAADGMMMAVKMGGATFATPAALFKTRMLTGLLQSGIEYDVTADGQRFLIGTQVGEPTPVSIILNWTKGMEQR